MDRPWELLAARTGLAIDEAGFREVLRRHIVVEERWDDVSYFRIDKDFEHLPRGTVLAAEGVLREYPHVPRVLHLARGLARAFDGPFHVEEKIDGYNVRAAWIGGRALAFSRGGYVCPFATDRLADRPEIGRFLERNPGLALCLELAGPGNPYNVEHPPFVPEDIAFFAFDLLEIDAGRFLAPADRAARLAGSGIATPRAFGTALPGETAKLAAIVREVDASGGEGIVLKSAVAGGPRVKYVTLGADARDLAATAGSLGAVPRSFLVNRLVQAAFTLHELEGGAVSPETARTFGEALLRPLLKSIRAVDFGEDPAHHPGEVEEPFEFRMREEKHVDRLLAHLERSSKTVQVRVVEKAREADGRWRVRLVKRYQQATGYFLSRLIGQAFVD